LPLPLQEPLSLLDPSPLEANLKRWVNWRALRTNLIDGALESLAVVATAARTGRSVCFLEGSPPTDTGTSHVIDYVPTRLSAAHLAASAAIPMLFPAIRLETPRSARGWYFDGGTRLNTPIKPALDLGATRLVVIGTQSLPPPSTASGRYDDSAPDLGVAGLHLLHGSLVDPLAEDMRTLASINRFFADPSQAPSAARYRKARGKSPYREVPYVFVSPSQPGVIGELASEVLGHRYAGLRGLRHPDFPLLSQLFGGRSETEGELLSYILFDPEFIEQLIDLGRADARRWIADDEGAGVLWQTGPPESI
jgi:NTE family protein